MDACIGIIGGMGPLATCDLMQKMIRHMDASKDQDYIRICVDCNTNIPDRTAAILKDGADPVPEMCKSAVRLQEMGATVLTISCNTAHYFMEKVQKSVGIPILHMPQETSKYLAENGYSKVGVLATDGTVLAGVYGSALREAGIELVYPNENEQAFVMSLIYDYVKAAKPFDECAHRLLEMVVRMQKEGAEIFILGCTELPIVFDQLALPVPTVDPTEVLACSAIRFCGGKVK